MKNRVFMLMLASVLALAACGFKLRGSYELPWQVWAVNLPQSSTLYALIKRALETGGPTRIVSDSQEAQAVLTLVDTQSKQVLSLDNSGKVREYRLLRSLAYTVTQQTPLAAADSADGKPGMKRRVVANDSISITRDITYSDAQVLSKEQEETLIWKDMQNDLVQQLLRRLAALRPPKEGEQTAVEPASPLPGR